MYAVDGKVSIPAKFTAIRLALESKYRMDGLASDT
jgi:predicted DNA-binding protein